jgi:hypothetical protein
MIINATTQLNNRGGWSGSIEREGEGRVDGRFGQQILVALLSRMLFRMLCSVMSNSSLNKQIMNFAVVFSRVINTKHPIYLVS